MGQYSPPEAGTIVDPIEAAESAGLTYVSDEEPGIRRLRIHGCAQAFSALEEFSRQALYR